MPQKIHILRAVLAALLALLPLAAHAAPAHSGALGQVLPSIPRPTPPKLPGSSGSSALPKASSSATPSAQMLESQNDEIADLKETTEGTAQAHKLRPFGANLFMGNFLRTREDGLNPNYVIMPGDHVAINVWGAVEVKEIAVVDGQGNIFIPQVGPIHLAGVKNSELTDVVRKGLSRVYTRYFDVYTNLITANPVAVFVTGGVERPGRYAGIPSDSSLFFLDQAGGINPDLGSYRSIDILRAGKVIASLDLYDFLLSGQLSDPQFQDGDTILVRRRGPVIELQGSVAEPALLEFKESQVEGQQALSVVPGAARATQVTVTGIRHGVPFSRSMPISDFTRLTLRDGDRIELRDDGRADQILVHIDGEYLGPSLLAIRRGARLVDVLNYVPINTNLANLDGIHLRRPSVAQAQKDAIDDALFRLERSALLALSDSDGETNIRVKEADLVQRFVERARLIQPLGRVVTSREDKQMNILLEEGDVIVIPQKTNVVRVSGEVFMSQAVMYRPGLKVRDYITEAGGFTERADGKRVVVHRPNGRVIVGDPGTMVQPGDEILVPPKIDTKLTQNILDITQIVYQVAVSAAVILFLVP